MDLATIPNLGVLWKPNNYLTMVSNIKGILNHIQDTSKDTFLEKSENMILA